MVLLFSTRSLALRGYRYARDLTASVVMLLTLSASSRATCFTRSAILPFLDVRTVCVKQDEQLEEPLKDTGGRCRSRRKSKLNSSVSNDVTLTFRLNTAALLPKPTNASGDFEACDPHVPDLLTLP
jgi:hypothetical protein